MLYSPASASSECASCCLQVMGFPQACLNVARIVGRLLDRGSLATPLPLIPDGDLVAIVQHMLIARGPSTVRVTKVEGHATAFDVERAGSG